MSRSDPAPLLGEEALERSSVAANCAMNRERGLDGPNSYAKELGFHPLDRLRGRPDPAWLDLCCGSGRALIEAAQRLEASGDAGAVRLVGVDLVDHFVAPSGDHAAELVTSSVATWHPSGTFDLITACTGCTTSATSSACWPARCHGSGRRRVSCDGPRSLDLPYVYLGADDRAGPNYTGQPVVNSHYGAPQAR